MAPKDFLLIMGWIPPLDESARGALSWSGIRSATHPAATYCSTVPRASLTSTSDFASASVLPVGNHSN